MYLLLVACAIFFWPILTGQRAFPPGDFYDQFYAFARYELAQLAAGRLPLWNPYTFSGHPFLADVQSAIFYPPGLLINVASLVTGFSPYVLELEAVVHYFLASAFTYLLGRRLFGSRFAALVAALTFTYGGYLTGYPPLQLAVLETDVWLPLILLLLGLAVERHNLSYIIAAGLALGIAFLAGHPQSAMYVTYTSLIYLVGRTASSRPSPLAPLPKGEGGGALLLGVGFSVGGSLSDKVGPPNPPILGGTPTLADDSPSSHPPKFGGRGGQVRGADWVAGGPLPKNLPLHGSSLSQRERAGVRALPAAIAIFLVTALGAASAQLLPSLEFTRLSVRAETTYEMVSGGFPLSDLVQIVRPGIVSQFSPLYVGILPLLLALTAVVVQRDRRIFGWAGLALVALLLSFGRNAFLYPIFYRLVPGFAWFRSQERAAFLFSFAMAILAGYGAAWLATRLAAWRWRIVLQPVLLCLIFVDLLITNSGTNMYPAQPQDLVYTSPLVEAMQVDADTFRVYNEWRWPGNYGDVVALEDTWGASPLRLARYDAFVNRLPEVHVWNLLNVKYVLTYRRDLGPGAELIGEEPPRPGGPDGNPTYLHRLKEPNPRVYVVHQAEIIPDDTAALARLRAATFNPQTAAVLATPPPLDLPGRPVPGSGARILDRDPGWLLVEAELAANGLLMVSELDYPGWRALVDGQPVPILRADVILRAIPLTAGRHQVEMIFDPPSVRWGLAISAVTWVVAVVLAVWFWRSTPHPWPFSRPPNLGGQVG